MVHVEMDKNLDATLDLVGIVLSSALVNKFAGGGKRMVKELLKGQAVDGLTGMGVATGVGAVSNYGGI